MKKHLFKRLIPSILILAVLFSYSIFILPTKVSATSDIINNGVYYIKSQWNNYYLDVQYGITSGTNVWIFPFNGTSAQQWRLTENADGTYTISTMLNTNLKLDAQYSNGPNPNVQIFTGNGTYCQSWNVIKNSDGTFRILSKYDLTDGLDVDGNLNVVSSDYYNGTYQKWTLELATTPTVGIVDNKTYYIKNAYTEHYLDAEQSMNGNVIQYAFHGYTNQKWKVVYQGNGWYKLYNQYPNYINDGRQCLDIGNYDNVDLWYDSPGDWILFRIISNGDGTYRLVNKWEGNIDKVLDVSSIDYPSNVIQYPWHGGNSQRWVFEEAFIEDVDYKLVQPTAEHPGYYTKSFSVSIDGDGHEQEILDAMNAWNNKAGTSITHDNNSNNRIGVYLKDFTTLPITLGEYRATSKSDGHATRFLIRLYKDNLGEYFSNCFVFDTQLIQMGWKHTVVHEIGHALGLLDDPTGAPSIMKYNYTSPIYYNYLPESADAVGVKCYSGRIN